MKQGTVRFGLLVFLLCMPVCQTFELLSGFTILGAGVTSAFLAAFQPLRCRFISECCTPQHIRLNETVLRESLKSKVYGQHLTVSAVLNHLRAYTRNKDHTKALALSFHGGTGTGKNYVSRIIAESMYRKGMKSKYVHLLSATKEFPHVEMLPLYKDKLKDLIETGVKQCEQSMFIFDEVDKMPPGLLDVVKPYLDFYEDLAGTDYRKAIFIFLSNTASTAVALKTLDHWSAGLSREKLQLSDMEKIVIKDAVNTKNSGMWHSNLLKDHMISAHIPFLPMEREHVRECIKDSLVSKNYFKNKYAIPQHIIKKIADQLNYYPEDQELFSVTGCKRVPEKVDYIMASIDSEHLLD